MNLPNRVACHLAVTGVAMIAAAVHAGGRPVAEPSTSAKTTVAYRSPAVTPPLWPSALRAAERARASRAEQHARPSRPASTAAAIAAVAPAVPPRAVAHQAAKTPVRRRPTGPTGWAALDSAIARIPTYRAGTARWLVGTADWYHATIYVSPSVPSSQLFNVVVHEWSHELSVLDYDGDVAAATRAMNATFGGGGLIGAERAADCMAVLQGATWTHYTACTDAGWRAAAAKLVAGRRL